MAKSLSITYNGKEYNLAFTRDTIRQMEQKGFQVANLERFPATTIPQFFEGAFLLHHKREKKETVQAIFNHLEDKEGLLEALTDLYLSSMQSLMTSEDVDGDESKKATWKVAE